MLPWYLRKTKSWKGLSADTTILLPLFCLTFLVVGLIFLGPLSLQPTLNWARARSWQATDAVMEAAQLECRYSRRHRPSYKVEVRFRYSYQGVEHTGTRHSFVNVSTNVGVPEMQQLVDDLPPGKKVTCWVNPSNPAESVMDRSLPAHVAPGLFQATPFLAFGMAGLGFLALPLFQRRFREKRQAQLAHSVAAGKLPPWVLQPFAPTPSTRRKGVALMIATDERIKPMLELLFLNLLWNSLVAFFVCAALYHWVHGARGTALFASLILTPFVVVGIILLRMLVKRYKSLRRPCWVAALHPVPGFGGVTVTCCWAWLEENRTAYAPLAVVRLVAQTAHWNPKFNSPALWLGGRCKGQRELASVEFPIAGGLQEFKITLPSLPPETVKQQNWSWSGSWGRWWQLEVTYRDGSVETAPITQPVELA